MVIILKIFVAFSEYMNFIVDIEGSPTFFGSKLIGVVFFRVS
jgi:hypothetical protein